MILRIGHLDFTVRPYRKGDEGFETNFGLANMVQQLILIDKTATPARQLETLLHEITHAAWNVYGHREETLVEEPIAEFVGNAFASVIINNPHFLPVLMALREGGSIQEP